MTALCPAFDYRQLDWDSSGVRGRDLEPAGTSLTLRGKTSSVRVYV